MRIKHPFYQDHGNRCKACKRPKHSSNPFCDHCNELASALLNNPSSPEANFFRIDDVMPTGGMLRVFDEEQMTQLLDALSIEYEAEYGWGELRQNWGIYRFPGGHSLEIHGDGLMSSGNYLQFSKAGYGMEVSGAGRKEDFPEDLMLGILKGMLSYGIYHDFTRRDPAKLQIGDRSITVSTPGGFLLAEAPKDKREAYLRAKATLLYSLYEKAMRNKDIKYHLKLVKEYYEAEHIVWQRYI